MSVRSAWVSGVIAMAGLLMAGSASAELTVSVSISGSVEELMPVLRHLRDMGVGVSGGEELMKLEMHSEVSGKELRGPRRPEANPGPPKPAPGPKQGVTSVKVEPATVKPGEQKVTVSAEVRDPERRVDTVAVKIGDQSFDLYDNGQHGDAKAADGVWTRAVTVPFEAGEQKARVVAYDVYGIPLSPGAKDDDTGAWTASAQVMVKE